MADGGFSIIGLEPLLAKLKGLEYDMKRKGGRSALRKAAKIVAEDAKKRAQALNDPATGRSIADNVAIRWGGRRFKRTGDLHFRIGIKGTAKTPPKGSDIDKSGGAPTPHWRLLEFGTEKMAARPFMRPALESNINKATNAFVTEYGKAIDRALKRAAKGK